MGAKGEKPAPLSGKCLAHEGGASLKEGSEDSTRVTQQACNSGGAVGDGGSHVYGLATAKPLALIMLAWSLRGPHYQGSDVAWFSWYRAPGRPPGLITVELWLTVVSRNG
eukprot:jgi/Chlat1/8389/Chrsp80S07905